MNFVFLYFKSSFGKTEKRKIKSFIHSPCLNETFVKKMFSSVEWIYLVVHFRLLIKEKQKNRRVRERDRPSSDF